ncbi:MAG: ABC-ATPase domain-containing protein [Oliverpabstia intestinalis]|nr:ABC-ATPase domain-containing protein [Oliverpabstia intestinalis]MDY5791962.1 ABC-ATPase domain-containing protein [Oliverpabstia intestinalis]
MNTSQDLKDLLFRINRKSYPAYKDTKGSYRFPGYVLSIDHVQGDPFAAPSKLSLHIKGAQAGFPETLYATREMRIALQDQLIRGFAAHIEKYSFRAKGSGKSGLISISKPGQEILERSACTMDAKNGDLTLRLEVGFPANGRTVNSGELIKILFDFLPVCVKASLFYRNLDARKLEQVRALAEDQTFIRKELAARNLTAFVANGAVLPRESGVSPLPMKNGISFVSPDSMAVTLHLPNHGPLTGMGIPCGITLIVGGGYHGKSTLLEALELGVYNHIAGDGREYVITRDDAVKIRAEDGRSIKHTDISFFINDLPNHKDTHSFYSEDASGSTSQAANVIEALETGSHLLLIDEDTSATNFMIRDELMQRVVNRNQEPITPFIERVQWLSDTQGISSILVAGSSGSYFHVADTILQMDHYKPVDITAFAKKEAEAFPSIQPSAPAGAVADYRRVIQPAPAFRPDRRLKMKVLGMDSISVNHDTIDLRCLEQLADQEQIQALSAILCYAERRLFNGKDTLQQIIDRLDTELSDRGLEILSEGGRLAPNLAMPRIQEVYACINRYRGLKI